MAARHLNQRYCYISQNSFNDSLTWEVLENTETYHLSLLITLVICQVWDMEEAGVVIKLVAEVMVADEEGWAGGEVVQTRHNLRRFVCLFATIAKQFLRELKLQRSVGASFMENGLCG